MTWPRFWPSSSTVVLPAFCVWTSLSEIIAASSACMPYAFIAVVRTSTDVAVVVKPAFARFAASETNCPTFSVDTLAESAW